MIAGPTFCFERCTGKIISIIVNSLQPAITRLFLIECHSGLLFVVKVGLALEDPAVLESSQRFLGHRAAFVNASGLNLIESD
jgi:hypothetical protein